MCLVHAGSTRIVEALKRCASMCTMRRATFYTAEIFLIQLLRVIGIELHSKFMRRFSV
jgi:hypothetical protein